MSGTISLSAGSRWSAASWLFDWVVRFLAREAEDPDVADELREAVDENLGWVDLASFPARIQQVIFEKIRYALVPAAEAELSSAIPNRQGVIDTIQELAGMASAASVGDGS